VDARLAHVALARERRRADQPAASRAVAASVEGESGDGRAPSLRRVAAIDPLRGDGPDEAERELRVLPRERPRDRRTKVVVLGLQAREPMAETREVLRALLGEGEEVLRVPRAHGARLVRLLELGGRELAQGLEHREARVTARVLVHEEALVDER